MRRYGYPLVLDARGGNEGRDGSLFRRCQLWQQHELAGFSARLASFTWHRNRSQGVVFRKARSGVLGLPL